MQPEWYYLVNRVQKGPVTRQQLAQLKGAGIVHDDTLVWREGMVSWEASSTHFPPSSAEPATVLDSPPIRCSQCERPLEPHDFVLIAGQTVCPACKSLALQLLQERVDPPPDPTAEALRKTYLSHEASLKSVGSLYLISGGFLMLGMLAAAASLRSGGDGAGLAQPFFIFMAAIGAGYTWVGVGLRKLHRTARTVAIVLSIIGLIGFPLGTLINGYVLWLLTSRKARTVFSDEYAQTIRATPHIQYRTSLIAWIILALIVVLAGLLIFGGAGMMWSRR